MLSSSANSENYLQKFGVWQQSPYPAEVKAHSSYKPMEIPIDRRFFRFFYNNSPFLTQILVLKHPLELLLNMSLP